MGGLGFGFADEINELNETTRALNNLKTVLAEMNQGSGGSTSGSTIPDIVPDGEKTTEVVEETTEAVTKLGEASSTASSAVEDLLQTERTFADVSADLALAFDHIGEKVEVFDEFDDKAAKIGALTTAINELIDSDIDVPAGELEKLGEQLQTLVSGITDTTDPLKTFSETIASLQVSSDLGILDSLQTAQAMLNAIETALKNSILADPNFINTEQFEKLNGQMELLRGKIQGVKETQDEVNTSFDMGATLGDAMGQIVGAGFSSMTSDGESFGESIKKIFLNMIAGALATAISNAIASAFSPASADNYITGGAAAPAKAAALTGVVGSLFAAIPKFHSGGMTLGPTLAMIGDNPSGREAVIPFERMGEFLGQVAGGNQNMNVTGKIQGHDIVLSQERAMRQRGR